MHTTIRIGGHKSQNTELTSVSNMKTRNTAPFVLLGAKNILCPSQRAVSLFYTRLHFALGMKSYLLNISCCDSNC